MTAIWSQYRHSVLVLGLLVTTNLEAEIDRTQTRVSETTIEATELSDSEQRKAKAWELTAAEWHRYQGLMEGIRSSVSPETLSPLEVLGIHARDESERRRYAERWARAMHADAERILAFQRAYDAAAERLFGDQLVIDTRRRPASEAPKPAFSSNDRLLLFVRTDCPACDVVLKKALSHIETLAGIDIYLMDGDRLALKDMRDWAKQQSINPDWVRARRVTLNRDDGELRTLDRTADEAPLIFLREDNETRPVAYAEL